VLNRANAKLGTNLTLHDLRHTCGIRLARDPSMTLVDIKTILRHRSVETTQIYTQVRLEEIIDQVLAHYTRPAPTAVANSAVGYDPGELRELFS
jgi:integrase